jgi:hypothetical protein
LTEQEYDIRAGTGHICRAGICIIYIQSTEQEYDMYTDGEYGISTEQE